MRTSLLLLCALFSLQVQAAELNCTSYFSDILNRYVPYCVDRATPNVPAAPGEPVVYFMHGTNGDAETWAKNNYQDSLADLRDHQKLRPMTFVSFDTSAYSFFSDTPEWEQSEYTAEAYETWFVTEFIPYIEKTLQVCNERKCRGIMGESMGGFGALKTALKHPELFSTISVNSPAFSPFDTKRPFWDWVGYYSHKHIGPLKGFLVTSIFFSIFPTEELFDENNPTYLAQNYSSIYPFPNLYFDMGGDDDYGFYDGYALFKNILDAKKIPYTTIFEPKGRHDMWERHASDALIFLQGH